MACKAPASIKALFDEANRLWPNRRRLSDGICASQKHHSQNPGSDHEPDANGVAHAADLTDDKESCDADVWAENLRRRKDRRVLYVICNRMMFSSYPTSQHPAWTWRPYPGPNPHLTHTHVSIHRTPTAEADTSPWFAPAAPQEPDDMPLNATDMKLIKDEVERGFKVTMLEVLKAQGLLDIGEQMDDVIARLKRVEAKP